MVVESETASESESLSESEGPQIISQIYTVPRWLELIADLDSAVRPPLSSIVGFFKRRRPGRHVDKSARDDKSALPRAKK